MSRECQVTEARVDNEQTSVARGCGHEAVPDQTVAVGVAVAGEGGVQRDAELCILRDRQPNRCKFELGTVVVDVVYDDFHLQKGKG